MVSQTVPARELVVEAGRPPSAQGWRPPANWGSMAGPRRRVFLPVDRRAAEREEKTMTGRACLIASGILLSLMLGGSAGAETLKLGLSTWVGYGPLYIAKDKGYFKDEGLDVELITMEDPKVRFPALAAGQLDVAVTTVDTILNYLSDQQSYRYLFALDDSKGGDGIVANKDIKTVADLKGKSVAYGEGSVSQFYLGVLLKQAGLSFDDIQTQNMTAGDAGAAFVAGRVDAAVTWEPWLTRGKQAPQGHLLVDSSSTPGLITDMAVTTPQVLAARQDDLKALYRAWVKAVEFQKAHPEEADAIMAKGVGGWLEDPKVFAETRAGIVYYDQAMNQAFIGTAEAPGPLVKTIDNAAELGKETGQFQHDVTPTDLIAFDIINQ
jgi:NitT/TauT family transport system substrate-binding protein